MNKFPFLIFLFFLLINCVETKPKNDGLIKENVNSVLDNWHKDVANVNFDAYFNAMTKDAIFIGTDANENWTKKEFMDFARPHFNKKKTWDFKPLERNVYISKDGKTVWFDELLDTWMKICRGSGVLVKNDNQWKIKHYVLSATIPNDSMKKVVKMKAKSDSIFSLKFIKN
jgi:ketosteroid isomerase-like protein